MISTRLHASIDYALATLFAGLAASRALSPPVRGMLGTTAAFHAGASVLTDYEGGLQPRLTMRQHLMLDVLGATALCGAGLLMRRQPPAHRALLVAARAPARWAACWGNRRSATRRRTRRSTRRSRWRRGSGPSTA